MICWVKNMDSNVNVISLCVLMKGNRFLCVVLKIFGEYFDESVSFDNEKIVLNFVFESN